MATLYTSSGKAAMLRVNQRLVFRLTSAGVRLVRTLGRHWRRCQRGRVAAGAREDQEPAIFAYGEQPTPPLRNMIMSNACLNAVYNWHSRRSGRLRQRSVKPSAKPTQVRTLDLPPPAAMPLSWPNSA